jgi:acylphosphatase
VFEGEPDAVEALIDFVRGDPGHSNVENVEVSEEEPEGLRGFETR